MKDREPFDLRGHHMLFSRINNLFATDPIHRVEQMAHQSPGWSVAQAVIPYLAGRISLQEKTNLIVAQLESGPVLHRVAPRFGLRLSMALRLVLQESEADGPSWEQLAKGATEMIEFQRRHGEFDPSDLSLGTPFHYLSVESPMDVVNGVNTLERHRAAAQSHWLTVVPVPAVEPGSIASELLDRETRILAEIRGARFVHLLDSLPQHYRRYSRDQSAIIAAYEQGSNPFDLAKAARRLGELHTELGELHDELTEAVPYYATLRQKPAADLDELTELLLQPS